MAETVDQATEMTAAVSAAGKSLGFGLKMRYEAVFREARRRIDRGDIGTPGEVVITYNQNLPPPDRAWYLEEGVLLGSMPHPFDLAIWWLGQEPEWLWVDTGSRLGYKGEDHAAVVIGHVRGGRSVLQMAYHSSFPEVAARDDLVFQIVGDSGYLHGERSGSLLSVNRKGRSRQTISAVNAFEAELRDFLSAIKDGRPPPVGGAAGLLAQKMIESARRSASSGVREEIG